VIRAGYAAPVLIVGRWLTTEKQSTKGSNDVALTSHSIELGGRSLPNARRGGNQSVATPS
jgi:hypothetical protein